MNVFTENLKLSNCPRNKGSMGSELGSSNPERTKQWTHRLSPSYQSLISQMGWQGGDMYSLEVIWLCCCWSHSHRELPLWSNMQWIQQPEKQIAQLFQKHTELKPGETSTCTPLGKFLHSERVEAEWRQGLLAPLCTYWHFHFQNMGGVPR